MIRHALPTLMVVLFASGCSGGEEVAEGAGGGPSGGGGGNGGTASGGAASGGGDSGLDLDVPENGFQVRTVGKTIQSGEDAEYCEVVQLPGTPDDTYYVTRLEAAMTPFSHHLITQYMTPGGEADQNSEVGEVRTCITPDVYGQDIKPVIGSQQRYRETAFPQGVGRIFKGGSKLVVDFHSLNTSSEPIEARHAINFHLADKKDIVHIARDFGFYNFGIYTPARTQASFTGECFFDADVTMHSLTRHTHRWGTDFKVWYAGGDRDGQHIWTSTDWEGDIDHVLEDGPVKMKAGEGFRFECAFDNTEDYPLKFGVKASDEMCILFGSWWATDPDETVKGQGCRMVAPDADGIYRE